MTRPIVARRDRRAIALGAVVVVPALLFVYGVQPYRRALADVRARTEHERAQLAHDRGLATRLPGLPNARTGMAREVDLEVPRLFDATDDLLATGSLAEYVATVAGASGVQLQQAETRPALSAAPGVRALHVEVHAEGDLDGILHFLRQLETGGKLIRLGELTVERAQGDVNGTKPADVEVLAVSADIYGYRLTGDSSNGGGATGQTTGAPSPITRVAYELPSIDAVVDRDPFMPTRSRPAIAYKLAMSGDTARSAAHKEPPCRLVGTVLPQRGRGFAMCQNADGVPHLVHLGAQVAGYTLTGLGRERAVFTTPAGGRLELHTPQPGSSQ